MHLATGVSAALLTSVWQGFVLTLCVWIALRLLPGVSAAWRSRLWLGVFLVAAGLPLLHRAGAEGGSVAAVRGGFHVDPRLALGLFCAWAVFAGWSILRLLGGALELRRIAREASPTVPPGELEDLFQGPRAVLLCVSGEVEVPSVAGFLRPRILLPAGLLERLSAADLRQIVLHELEHLRRGDDWTNLLQKIAIAIFPLNPVLLWLERRLCVERELACDDGVLQATGAGKAYAICLTNLAEQTMLRRGRALLLGAWQRRSELTRRVQRILLPTRPGTAGRQGAALACAMAGACAVAALVLAHAPLVVSFNPATAPVVAASATTVPTGSFRGNVRATMVRASMPIPVAKSVVTARTAKIRNVRRVVISARRRSIAGESLRGDARVVMIRWSATRAMATQAVYFTPADPESLYFRYAAVPVSNGWVRNGWLILQM